VLEIGYGLAGSLVVAIAGRAERASAISVSADPRKKFGFRKFADWIDGIPKNWLVGRE
jgi:hypothetical protein